MKVKFWTRLGKPGGLPGGGDVSPEKEERAVGVWLQWGGKWQVGEGPAVLRDVAVKGKREAAAAGGERWVPGGRF